MHKHRSPGRNWSLRIAALGLVGVALAGSFAFKKVFPHSGEDALDLVPESAVMVGTVDLDPAPSQVLALRRIDEALKRNHLSDSIGAMATDALNGFSGQKELWALSKHSISACALCSSAKKDDMSGALLIPLTDASQAEQIIKKNSRPEFWKGTPYYRLFHSTTDVMLEEDTLIVTKDPWVLHEMARTRSGEVKPITKSPAFIEARAKEPSDASLIVMISPKATEMLKSFVSQSPLGWTSISVTVQEGGLALSVHGRADANGDQATNALASIKPLREDLLKVLPSGAYGVFAVSQPSKYLEAAEASSTDAEVAKGMRKGEDEIRKESGIDIEKDVAPALQGDMVLAAYPSSLPASGVDLLLVADNQNGADPADLARKFQGYLDKQMSGEKKYGKNWAAPVPRADGTEFKLGAKLEKEMRDSMSFDKSGAVRTETLTAGKTVAWANVNGAFFIATSQNLLDKAITTYGGSSTSLANDSSMTLGAGGGEKDQTFAIFSLARIAQAVRNSMNPSKMSRDNAKMMDQVLGLFDHLSTPLSIRSSISPDGTGSGELFAPVDYDKVIDLVGTFFKAGNGGADGSPLRA